MNNLNYDFHNTGYKIHIPCVDSTEDSLTRKIADFLDQKFGLKTNTAKQYQAGFYKVGSGGETADGKGITLYGRTQSMQEMQELAKEIEEKFGQELSECIKKNNINPEDPIQLTQNVRARFAVYNHGIKTPGISGITKTLWTYPWEHNKSGALPTQSFKRIDGTIAYGDCLGLKNMPEIDQKFWHGDSTMYAIDNFGELFTGKIENGKVPQFIMDGLPKEYLQHYNLTEKDIISRINKGTKQIVANMLEDVVNKPNSAILRGNPPWLATLDTQVINEAKQLLAQYEPQTVQKLEQMLPQLEQKCPALSVLKQTTPFAQMKITPVQPPVKPVGTNPVNTGNNPVSQPTKPQVNPTTLVNPHSSNPVGTQNPVNPTPKPQSTPNTNVGGNSAKVGWFEKLGTKGKVGLAVTGAALAAGTIYFWAHHNEPQKTITPSENTKPQTQPETYQNTCSNIYNNPYQNYYNMNGFMRI